MVNTVNSVWKAFVLSLPLALLGAAMLMPVEAGAASYYECVDGNGRKLFSQSPCPGNYKDEKKHEYQTHKQGVSLTGSAAGEREISTDNADYQSMRDNNRRLELRRNINRLQQQLDTLEADRDNRIASMNNTLEGIAGNNAGNRRALVELQISREEQKYEQRIEKLRGELKGYTAEMEGLSLNP